MDPGEWEKRFAVADRVFSHTFDMTKHEDEKAIRILSSISFLTVAVAALFVALRAQQKSFFLGGLDLIPVAFLAYMSSVVVGAFKILQAIGPRFKAPKDWKPGIPVSLFLFLRVVAEPEQRWLDFIRGQPEDVFKKASEDMMFEARIIAGRVREKTRLTEQAKIFFELAILFLFILVALATMSYLA
jgi:hypothetical protein